MTSDYIIVRVNADNGGAFGLVRKAIHNAAIEQDLDVADAPIKEGRRSRELHVRAEELFASAMTAATRKVEK